LSETDSSNRPQEKKICRIFYFGGCGGNDNNFASVKECAAACPIDESAQQSHLQVSSFRPLYTEWFSIGAKSYLGSML
jgi:hypothetical protein